MDVRSNAALQTPDDLEDVPEQRIKVRFNPHLEGDAKFEFPEQQLTVSGTAQILSYELDLDHTHKDWEYGAVEFQLPKDSGSAISLITTPGRIAVFQPDNGMTIRVFRFKPNVLQLKVWNGNEGKTQLSIGVYLHVRNTKEKKNFRSHDPQVVLQPKTS